MANSASASQIAAPAPDELCRRAMALQLGGELNQALDLYRDILLAHPTHAAANHCVGMLHVQLRRPEEALPYLLAALEASPEVSHYWLGLLEALQLAGRTLEARNTLALARRHGLAGSAVEDFANRLEAKHPQLPAGDAVLSAEQQESELLGMLGRRQLAEGLALARGLTERFAQRGLGWKVLGTLLLTQGVHEEGLAAMRTSVRLMPQDPEAWANLGLSLAKLSRFGEAEDCLHRALQIDPGYALAHFRLVTTYELQGRLADAQASLRRGIALRTQYVEGDDEQLRSNLLFLLSHDATLDADSLFAEHRRYGEFVEGKLRGPWPTHRNLKDPQRRLKVGLVSADFYDHAVATFIEPVLSHLQHAPNLELHAYSNHIQEDAVSRRLRGYFKAWYPIRALSHDELASKIRGDEIDILIDLSGHTADNRLPAFARKPAPIQVSWIGYPGTTGLDAMDYYLTDRHFLPPGQFDRQFTEKLVYLHALAPFQPCASAPPVNALPALATRSLRFASFNQVGKINDSSIRLWSQLLRALPSATLMLAGIPPGLRPERFIDGFAAHGIASERLTFHSRCSMERYLALHHQVDICLDTLPYTGGTTTSHALWMGVPTLTVAGSTPAARQGAAIQELLGLERFCAASPAQFVEHGVYWSTHLEALAQVRAGLRARWQQAPGRQCADVAAGLDRAWRHMWRRWCAGLPAESFAIDAPRSQT